MTMNKKELSYNDVAEKQQLKFTIAVKYIHGVMNGIVKKYPNRKAKIGKLMKNKRAIIRAAMKIAVNDKAFLSLYGNKNEKELAEISKQKDADIILAMSAERKRMKEIEKANEVRREAERRAMEMNNRHEIPQIGAISNMSRGM